MYLEAAHREENPPAEECKDKEDDACPDTLKPSTVKLARRIREWSYFYINDVVTV